MYDEEIHCVINYLLTSWSLCLPSVWEGGRYDHQKRLNFLTKWQLWKKIDWFGFALIYLKVQFWVSHHQFGFIGDRSERIEPGRAAGEHLSIWAFERLTQMIWAASIFIIFFYIKIIIFIVVIVTITMMMDLSVRMARGLSRRGRSSSTRTVRPRTWQPKSRLSSWKSRRWHW